MTESGAARRADREVVALFANREKFEAAVESLLHSSFERTDLSVLASHESLEAAGEPGKPWKDVLTALVGEIKFEGPLIASGVLVLSGGPLASSIAALIGAAVGGIASKEILDEVTASPHTEDFARSLEAGSVILWVRAEDMGRETMAIDILQAAGGSNVHVHEAQSADQ